MLNVCLQSIRSPQSCNCQSGANPLSSPVRPSCTGRDCFQQLNVVAWTSSAAAIASVPWKGSPPAFRSVLLGHKEVVTMHRPNLIIFLRSESTNSLQPPKEWPSRPLFTPYLPEPIPPEDPTYCTHSHFPWKRSSRKMTDQSFLPKTPHGHYLQTAHLRG